MNLFNCYQSVSTTTDKVLKWQLAQILTIILKNLFLYPTKVKDSIYKTVAPSEALLAYAILQFFNYHAMF